LFRSGCVITCVCVAFPAGGFQDQGGVQLPPVRDQCGHQGPSHAPLCLNRAQAFTLFGGCTRPNTTHTTQTLAGPNTHVAKLVSPENQGCIFYVFGTPVLAVDTRHPRNIPRSRGCARAPRAPQAARSPSPRARRSTRRSTAPSCGGPPPDPGSLFHTPTRRTFILLSLFLSNPQNKTLPDHLIGFFPCLLLPRV